MQFLMGMVNKSTGVCEKKIFIFTNIAYPHLLSLALQSSDRLPFMMVMVMKKKKKKMMMMMMMIVMMMMMMMMMMIIMNNK